MIPRASGVLANLFSGDGKIDGNIDRNTEGNIEQPPSAKAAKIRPENAIDIPLFAMTSSLLPDLQHPFEGFLGSLCYHRIYLYHDLVKLERA